MSDMLTMLLLGAIALGIGFMVLLVIYLVDRFNGLERDTQAFIRDLEKSRSKTASGPFAGLSGRALWDAVSGQPPPDMDEIILDGVRERYRAVLGQHIAAVFKEGAADAAQGMDAPPGNTRSVRTLRGQVESWLPTSAINEIYRYGQAFARNDPAELPGLRQSLDAVHSQLHQQCGLEVPQPISGSLIPQPASAEAAPAALPPSTPTVRPPGIAG